MMIPINHLAGKHDQNRNSLADSKLLKHKQGSRKNHHDIKVVPNH